MKSIRIIYLLAALLARQTALAQLELVWHVGEVTLNTGITLRGKVCYQPYASVLLFQTTPGLRWKSYTADQLIGFTYVDLANNGRPVFKVYTLALGESRSCEMIFEELVPGEHVRLLQLDNNWLARRGAPYGLPQLQVKQWQTEKPWFVWVDGRFLRSYRFVDEEIDGLLAQSAVAVREHFARWPRPTTPNELARWISYYNRRSSDGVVPDNQPIASAKKVWFHEVLY